MRISGMLVPRGKLFRGRLMAGRQALDLQIMVRVHAPEQANAVRCGGAASQLLGSRMDEKAGAMREFAKQGERHEAGGEEISARKFTEPSPCPGAILGWI